MVRFNNTFCNTCGLCVFFHPNRVQYDLVNPRLGKIFPMSNVIKKTISLPANLVSSACAAE